MSKTEIDGLIRTTVSAVKGAKPPYRIQDVAANASDSIKGKLGHLLDLAREREYIRIGTSCTSGVPHDVYEVMPEGLAFLDEFKTSDRLSCEGSAWNDED